MSRKPDGVALGIVLGLVNATVVSIGLSALVPDDRLRMAALVLVIGSMPAVMVGALLGRVAEVLAARPVALRRICIAGPAVLSVVVLGSAFALNEAVLVSCIPTVAAALWLERATRQIVDAPVPMVTVRR